MRVVLVSLALAPVAAGCAALDPVRARLDAASAALRARDFARARHEVTAALRLRPDDARAVELLVSLLGAEHGLARAVRAMERLAARAGGRPGADYGHALALVLSAGRSVGPRRQAEALLRRILRAHPTYGAAYRLLAKLLADDARYEDALRLLEQSIQLAPRYGPSYRSYFELCQALGNDRRLRDLVGRLPRRGRRRLRAATASLVERMLSFGRSLSGRGRHRQAYRYSLRAARAFEAIGMGCVGSFFLRIAADAERRGHRFPQAARLLERGARRCLAEGRLAMAAVRFRDAGLFRKMGGDFEGALAAFRDWSAVARRAGDERGVARALRSQGTELSNLGRFREAEKVFEDALTIARRIGDASLEADVLVSAGNSCAHRSAMRCAVQRLRRAVALRERQGDPRALSTALADLGKVLSHAGEASAAIRHLERALAIDRALGDEGAKAGTYVNLGAAYRSRGDHVRALGMYRRAARTFARIAGMERFQAIAVSNVGNVYRSLGMAEKALAYHEKALALKRGRATDRELAETLLDIAHDLSRLGRSSEAVGRVREALALFTASGNRQAVSETRAVLAGMLGDAGKPREARALFAEAIAEQERLGLRVSLVGSLRQLAVFELLRGDPRRALEALERSRTLGASVGTPATWSAFFLEGEIRLRLGDRPGAVAALLNAVDLVDEERRSLRAEAFKMSFLAQVGSVHHRAATLVLEGGGPGALETAFRVIERGRGRGLLDLIESAGARAAPAGRAEAALLAKERRLAAMATWLQKGIARAAAAGDARRVAGLAERRRKALSALDEVRAEIRASDPMLATASSARPVGLAELRRDLLDPRTALLEYSVGAHETVLLVVTRERAAHHLLPIGREALAERVAAFRRRYLLRRELTRPRGFIRDGRALYRSLLGAVDPALLAGRDLIVVPDGPLVHLPFEALVVEGDPARRERTLLVERHAVTYAPSASVLAALAGRLRKRPPARQGLVAIGDPAYEIASRGRARRVLEPLPGTREEVRRIARVLDGKRTLLFGADAREDRVKAGALREHRIVHIAGHGILDDEFQAIALAQNASDGEDGFLELREIYGLSLDAELVVLSACQTGEGKLVSGEGVVGLSHAFLFAGAPRLVVSLWKVADASTAVLMVRMYRKLGPPGAPGVARALRAAKLEMLRGPWAAPYYWAPFIAVGLP